MTSHDDEPGPSPAPDPIRAARDEAEAADVVRADAATSGEQAGDLVGRYKLLQQIGEGGFGTVWMAEQREPVKRRVALKIIKLGMDTRQVIARFEAERQALAMMDHPNIAKVLDGGASDAGRPFFVMELVKGVPIVEYCDDQRLDTDARLSLFSQVCQAIQHAHQKGIIHRDVKPSNVLVTLHDGVPVPKVIDFGIAKAVNQELTEKTLFTEYGRIVGTPDYMSPEQAEMSGLDIDTRTDVYSLGVLLYELLTGTTPLDVRALLESGYHEMLRAIREDEPHKPSTRVSALGDTATRTAERRQTDARRLETLLRGDLDWIAMKCLEKDRTRRYETASELAEDVRRHLGHEPVIAGPPSASYRVRKFVRRNRRVVGAAVVLLVALVLGIAGTTWGLVGAVSAREAEALERERAESFGAFTAGMLLAIEPEVARGMDTALMRMVLAEASARIEAEQDIDPAVEADVRLMIGRAYMAIAEYDDALRHLERARTIRVDLLGSEDWDSLESANALALLYRHRGGFAEAAAMLAETLDVAREVFGPEHPDTLKTASNLGTTYRRLGRFEEAELLLSETLDTQRQVLGSLHLDTAITLGGLATLYTAQGRHAEAEPLYAEQLATNRELAGDEHPGTLRSLNNLGYAYLGQDRYDEAEPLFREAIEADRRVLGPEHPVTLMPMTNLAILHLYQGDYDEAEPLFEETLELTRRALGPEHPDVALCLHNLAVLNRELGRYAEAEALWVEAVDLYRQTLGEDHPQTLRTTRFLAELYANQGKKDAARPLVGVLLEHSVRSARAEGASAAEKNGCAWTLLTCEPADLRDPETALGLALEANDMTGHEDPASLDTLALAYHSTGDTAKAVETQHRAISFLPPGDSPLRASLEEALARFEAALSTAE